MSQFANVSTAWIIAIAAAVVVVVGLIAWFIARRHSGALREQYGPEYSRTVRELGTRRGEKELLRRQERVDHLDLIPLTAEQRNRFSRQWMSIQAMFVDDPGGAVTDADRLVEEVMKTRGYPVADFERRAADLSVRHGGLVEHYRAAHATAESHRQGRATTEELRRAVIYYRALFEDLLDEHTAAGADERVVERSVERDVARDARAVPPVAERPIAEDQRPLERDDDVRS